MLPYSEHLNNYKYIIFGVIGFFCIIFIILIYKSKYDISDKSDIVEQSPDNPSDDSFNISLEIEQLKLIQTKNLQSIQTT